MQMFIELISPPFGVLISTTYSDAGSVCCDTLMKGLAVLYGRAIAVAFACYATQHFDYHICEAKVLSPGLLGLLENLLRQDGRVLPACCRREWPIATHFWTQDTPTSVR
jgi:hypothetical protein